MSIVVPILIVSLIVGAAAKRTTAVLWLVVGLVIVMAIGLFSLHH